MKLPKRIFWWCSSIVAIWLIFCSIAGVFAVEWALHPARLLLSANADAQANAIARSDRVVLEPVSISADDGAVLRGWRIRTVHGNGDAVILLHGQSDNRTGMVGTAQLLLRHGYSVLLPDARAHGVSGGALATYGVKEANDIRRWFEWLGRTEVPHCIYGLGESMGAAELLQSLKREAGFCAVVAESPFANFREASYDRMGERIGAGAWAGRTLMRPAVEVGLLYAHWKYGIELSQAAPDKAVAGSRTPVLLIHGMKDDNLPPHNSELIIAQSRGRIPQVALWEPKEAGHCGAAGAEPKEYERRVIEWFGDHHSPSLQ
ncbi:MAG TPA: alpha/beta fold hydrolase [Terracidiphilus sp.]|nr:alpha/beta fold hydrolase [Terracidiphilus sp.]